MDFIIDKLSKWDYYEHMLTLKDLYLIQDTFRLLNHGRRDKVGVVLIDTKFIHVFYNLKNYYNCLNLVLFLML